MAAAVDLCWDTASVRPDERFSFFVDGICRAFTRLDPEISDPDVPFFVRIRHREVGDSAITHLHSSKYRVRRLPVGIAQSQDHDFFLNFIVSGTINASQKGHSDALSGGSIFVLDNARPFELDLRSHGAFDSHVVRLRRTPFLEQRSAGLLNFGKQHSGHRLMPLLRMNLAQLARTGETAGNREVEYFGQAVVRLVDLILTGDSIETMPSKSVQAWYLIRAEIDRHIGDPDFTLENLAARLGVSTRFIQKVCAAQNCTFSDYLRERRLAAAARCLESGESRPSVEEIAYSSGFRNLSTFYRSFRRRYGATPGSYRH